MLSFLTFKQLYFYNFGYIEDKFWILDIVKHTYEKLSCFIYIHMYDFIRFCLQVYLFHVLTLLNLPKLTRATLNFFDDLFWASTSLPRLLLAISMSQTTQNFQQERLNWTKVY